MRAEVAVQLRQQELAQERIKAEIAVTQATGRPNSIRAEAQSSSPQAAVPRYSPRPSTSAASSADL